jgi:hypothetical protein
VSCHSTVGNTPLETRDVTVTLMCPRGHRTDSHLVTTYTRSSFLHRLNNAFASVTTCGRVIFSDLCLGFNCQLHTCSFWCITSRSVFTFRSSLRCAWARFVGVLSTAFCEQIGVPSPHVSYLLSRLTSFISSLRWMSPQSSTLASLTVLFAAFPRHNQLAHSFDRILTR